MSSKRRCGHDAPKADLSCASEYIKPDQRREKSEKCFEAVGALICENLRERFEAIEDRMEKFETSQTGLAEYPQSI